jgi:hypothetical protein
MVPSTSSMNRKNIRPPRKGAKGGTAPLAMVEEGHRLPRRAVMMMTEAALERD